MLLLFIAAIIAMLHGSIGNNKHVAVSAFIPPPPSTYRQSISSLSSPSAYITSPITFSQQSIMHHQIIHPALSRRQITKPSSTHLQSFFGLGPGELILIFLAGLIVIGPSKLLQFSKVAGKTAAGLGDEWSEIKSIPEEFQKGMEEGEIEARSRKAKVMDTGVEGGNDGDKK